MKTQWAKLGLTAILVLSLVGGTAIARESKDQMAKFQSKLLNANDLIGAKVINQEGKRLGTVEDIVLTPQRDAISYVALSHGGVLGFGGKLFAVPWAAFETGLRENALVLHIDEAYFKTARSFEKGNWPLMADRSWIEAARGQHEYGEQALSETDEYMGAEPRSEPMPPATERYGYEPPISEPMGSTASPADIKYRRLTELIGTAVKNPQGTELGDLDNVVIDVQQGKVAYAILEVSSSFLGMNKKLAAIPWSAIQINERQGLLTLNADKATLQAIAFDEKNFPNLADPQYSRDLHQRFNARPYWEALGFVPGEQRERPTTPGGAAVTSPWAPTSEYNKMFNPNEVKTFHGTIESVGVFNLEGTNVSGVRLRLRADNGELLTVHVGPRSYLDSHNLYLHHGDEVTIMGAPAKYGWRNVILASQVRYGDRTLDLRAKDGKPLWTVEEMGSPIR